MSKINSHSTEQSAYDVLNAFEKYRHTATEEQKAKDLERLENECVSDVAFVESIPKIMDVWHKYPSEKPGKCDDCIVAFDSGNVFVAHYNVQRDHWYDADIANNLSHSKVIAWMEFPKHPNKI